MNKQGFTLIEIMIVVAIIAVMASFGMSGFKGRIQKDAVREVESVFTTTLTNTRDECFLTGSTRNININLSNNLITVFNGSDEIRRKSIPTALTYEKNNEPASNNVGVNSSGNFTSGNFSFYAFDKTKKKPLLLITVDQTSILLYGKVRVFYPTSLTTMDNYDDSANYTTNWNLKREM